MSANKRSTNLTEIPGTKKKTRAQKTERTKQIYKEVKQEVIAPKPDMVQGEIVLGRPTLFSQDLANEICSRIASGESMRTVSKDPVMPAMSTIFKWLQIHPTFTEQYTRATTERAEAFHEDILDIADDGSNDWMEAHYGDSDVWITNGEALQRSRLRVETRKWLMSKMNPKKYGDKVDLTTNGKDLPQPMLGGTSINPHLLDDMKKLGNDNPVSENAG